MPKGIIATVDNGFAQLDFVDPSLRGPALNRLLEIGGPETIETVTRVGPRRQYRVPEGNAREAGLLDGDTEQRPRSAGQDTGFAGALADADPQTALEGDEAAVSRPVQITSEGTYVGQTSAAEERELAPSPLNIGVDEDSTVGYGGGNAAEVPVHRDVIGHVRENTPPPTEVEPQPVVPVSAINLGLAHQDSALPDDPGARPDAGGPALAHGDVRVQSTRESGAERRSADEISAGSAQTPVAGGKRASDSTRVQTEASAGTAEPTPRDTEDVVEYPEGTPTDDWRRDELEAYALKVKGLDVSSRTDFPNKKSILAVVK